MESNQPQQSWLQRIKTGMADKAVVAGQDFKNRIKEGGVVTGVTPFVDKVVQLSDMVGNRASEIKVGVKDAGQQVYGRIDQTIDNTRTAGRDAKDQASEMIANAGEIARNVAVDIGDSPIKTADGREAGIRERARLLLERNLQKIGTWTEDVLIPKMKEVMVLIGNPESEVYATPSVSKESEKAPTRQSKVIEGNILVQKITSGYEAAVAADQMDDSALILLIEKALGGTEISKKVAKTVFKAFASVTLEISKKHGSGTIGQDALTALEALNEDPVLHNELKNINVEQLIKTLTVAFKTVAEARSRIEESRGESNLSFKYEKKLSKECEAAQESTAALGLEIRRLLPEHAKDLKMGDISLAKGKGFEFARKAKDAIRSLKSIGLSLEERFPQQVDKIREELKLIISDWQDAKNVIPVVTKELFTKELGTKAKNDLAREFISKDPSFASLTENNDMRLRKVGLNENQIEVLGKVGVNFVEGDATPYQPIEGGLFGNAVEAYTQYTVLVKAYEVAREQVAEHPEVADRLIAMAEALMQATHAMADTQARMQIEFQLQARNVKNTNEIKRLQGINRPEEAAKAKVNHEYYTKNLEAFKARLNKEVPVIKKALTIAAVTGGLFAVALGAWEYNQAISSAEAVANGSTIALRADVAQLMQQALQEVAVKMKAITEITAPIVSQGKSEGVKNALSAVGTGLAGVMGVLATRFAASRLGRAAERFANWRLGTSGTSQEPGENQEPVDIKIIAQDTLVVPFDVTQRKRDSKKLRETASGQNQEILNIEKSIALLANIPNTESVINDLRVVIENLKKGFSNS